jgi:hypothetical protein
MLEKVPLKLPNAARMRRAAPASTEEEPSPRSSALKAAAITFAIGIASLAAIGALVLTEGPPRLVRVSPPGIKAVGVEGATVLGQTSESPSICQPGEVLHAGVSAIRLSLWGFFGARIHLVAYEGSHLLTEGRRGANWTSDSVTVPVRPLQQSHSNVDICFAVGPNSEPILILGAKTEAKQSATIIASNGTPPSQVMTASGRERLPGRMVIEYTAPGKVSWWSKLLTVARHMGLGRAYSGTWIALLVAALMLAVGVLSVRLALKEIE